MKWLRYLLCCAKPSKASDPSDKQANVSPEKQQGKQAKVETRKKQKLGDDSPTKAPRNVDGQKLAPSHNAEDRKNESVKANQETTIVVATTPNRKEETPVVNPAERQRQSGTPSKARDDDVTSHLKNYQPDVYTTTSKRNARSPSIATDRSRRSVPFEDLGRKGPFQTLRNAHNVGIVSDVSEYNYTKRPANMPGEKQADTNGQSPATNGINGKHTSRTNKRLVLNAFVEMCSGHQSPGLWRHPDDQSTNFNKLKHWTDLAQKLEAGKFHGIFIADVLGGYDVYGGPKNLTPAVISGAQWPVNEPLSVVPAMASVTQSIGFGVTVSTTYEQPYHLARRMSTLDHLTEGRCAWNVVTSYLDSAARNMGISEQREHDERYKVCEEYMQVVYKLWESSWRDDAVILDRKQGIHTHPDRVREINHVGKYFTVPGPHICQPSPQRTPVIFQAGTSKAGKTFAAKHAEAIFISPNSPAACVDNIRDIRQLAKEYGRDPYSIKFLAKICPVIGRTEEEAKAKFEDYIQYGSYEGALSLFGGWTGVDMAPYADDDELRQVESNAIRSYIEGLVKHAPDGGKGKWTKARLAREIMVGGLGATVVGTASQVADEFERWVEEADVDGFNIAYALMPKTFEDVIELLIPELQKRGIFWQDYTVPGGTYRENLYQKPGLSEPPADHPASKYAWKAPTATTDQKSSADRKLYNHAEAIDSDVFSSQFG